MLLQCHNTAFTTFKEISNVQCSVEGILASAGQRSKENVSRWFRLKCHMLLTVLFHRNTATVLLQRYIASFATKPLQPNQSVITTDYIQRCNSATNKHFYGVALGHVTLLLHDISVLQHFALKIDTPRLLRYQPYSIWLTMADAVTGPERSLQENHCAYGWRQYQSRSWTTVYSRTLLGASKY